MATKYRVYNFGGVKLNESPFSDTHRDGDLLTCQNLDSVPYGAKTKRSGYITTLGTVTGDIHRIWSWEQENGNQYLYHATDALRINYSDDGTADWAVTGNGTTSLGGKVDYAFLENTMILGDAQGSTRHSTDGTSFTNTTGAPVAGHFTEYNQRIYAGGTSSTLFWSNAGTPTDWTNNSSSIKIPSEGKIESVRTVLGEVLTTKKNNSMHHWNEYRLEPNPAKQGPSSWFSTAERDGIWFWLNRSGIYAYDSGGAKIISRNITDLIYNNSGSAMTDLTFDSAPGEVFRDYYHVAIGDTTSQILGETFENSTLRYNLYRNEWDMYNTAHAPTAFHALNHKKSVSNIEPKLLFAATTSGDGQVYEFIGTATSDDGAAIEAKMMGFLDFGAPEKDKRFKEFWAFASPGCGANLEVALSDNYSTKNLQWQTVGELREGRVFFNGFPANRKKLMFYRLNEKSTNVPFTFYGFTVNLEGIGR